MFTSPPQDHAEIGIRCARPPACQTTRHSRENPSFDPVVARFVVVAVVTRW
jgi:hypothetical protein